MGDVLLTTPLIRAIRQRHPTAWIAYLTKTQYVPLLGHNPRINQMIEHPRGESLGSLSARVREGRFTHFLDLHGSLRSRALRRRVPGPWRSYPKHRLARSVLIRFKRDIYRDRRPVVERYFDAAADLDVVPDEGPLDLFLARAAVDEASRFLAGRGLGQSRTLMAVVPGAAHATKRWPADHWRRLVALLAERGHDIVVLGGAAERALGEEIAAAGGPAAASAAGLFDLQTSGALLKQARCAVSGDTGLMHMATAVGTPVVSLFGPTVKAFGFVPYRARATILERDLSCRPCSAIGGPRCPMGHHRCLADIEPDQVIEAIRRLPR